jgi:hypothetical protein
VEIPNKFAALENSDKSLDINSAREITSEIIQISLKDYLGYHRLSIIYHVLMMSAKNS